MSIFYYNFKWDESMSEEFEKHLNNISKNFLDNFKESLNNAGNYAKEKGFDEDTSKKILIFVYEQQILTLLLTIFSNYDIDDFVDSVHRMMKIFETRCEEAKEYNELYSLVSKLLNKEEE